MRLREYQRFHDDRHDAARCDRRANVNVVEVTKLEAVECDEISFETELVAQYRAECRGDVAVTRDDERATVGGRGDPFREGPDARVLRLAVPLDGERDRSRPADIAAEPHDRHVAQRKPRVDPDRAAGDLHRE